MFYYDTFTVVYRYDFRKRVADVLNVHISRVSILPGSPSQRSDGKCQQVIYLVSGKQKLKIWSATFLLSSSQNILKTWCSYREILKKKTVRCSSDTCMHRPTIKNYSMFKGMEIKWIIYFYTICYSINICYIKYTL